MLPHQFCTLLEGESCPSPHGVPSAVPGPEQVLTQHRHCDHWPRGWADQGYCYMHFGVRQATCVSSEGFSPEVEGPPFPNQEGWQGC